MDDGKHHIFVESHKLVSTCLHHSDGNVLAVILRFLNDLFALSERNNTDLVLELEFLVLQGPILVLDVHQFSLILFQLLFISLLYGLHLVTKFCGYFLKFDGFGLALIKFKFNQFLLFYQLFI